MYILKNVQLLYILVRITLQVNIVCVTREHQISRPQSHLLKWSLGTKESQSKWLLKVHKGEQKDYNRHFKQISQGQHGFPGSLSKVTFCLHRY